MNEFKFELNQPVEDKLTGFKGIVNCRAQYYLGNNRYGVSCSIDGKIHEEWFDELRLKHGERTE